MSLRELVSGGLACAPEDAAGASSSSQAAAANPLASLANALLYEPEQRAQYEGGIPPGEIDHPRPPPPPPGPPGRPGLMQRAFRGPSHAPWMHRQPGPSHFLPPEEEALFENAFSHGGGPPPPPGAPPGAPGLQELERRAYAAAHEMFGDNPQLIEEQVHQFLQEVHESQAPPPPPQMGGRMGAPPRGMGPGFSAMGPQVADGWAEGFRQEQMGPGPGSLADEFRAQESLRGDAWVDDFASFQIQDQARQAASVMEARAQDAGFENYAENLWKQEVVPGSTSLADEFATTEASMDKEAEDWAQEHADEESWGDKFASLEGQDNFEEELFNYLGRDANETEYEFSTDNPYLGREDAMLQADRLEEEGELMEATLALEAVVQAEPRNSTAWFRLGELQAECDYDQKAISALKRCLEAGEDGASHMDALLALGISYTNELNQSRALDYLRRWMDRHPQVSDALKNRPWWKSWTYDRNIPAAETSSETQNEFAAHSELLQRAMNAARVHPNDANLHTIIGVLYNLSREYEEAQVAFTRAIELQGDNYKLWNRLGATFANGDNEEEALRAYRKAVDLKPGYVRAWVNVGTAYANQGKYEHASRFYLRGLELNPRASHIWSYLQTVLLAMHRSDLLPLVADRNLDQVKAALSS